MEEFAKINGVDDKIMSSIKIYSNDDKKLKFLGQILHSDTSRKILQILIEKELTSNEISFETGISLSLVIHHVNNMIQAGIVTISKTSVNTKNQPMKHYIAKTGIVILPKGASLKAKQSKSFLNSLKSIMKFTSIGIAGLISWQLLPKMLGTSDDTIEPQTINKFALEDPNLIVIPLIVIILGLIIERIVSNHKHKKTLSNI